MSSPTELLNVALQQHQAGQLLEAERLYEAVLLEQPNQANVLYLLGLVNHQRGRLETAAMWYLRAIAVNPGYADAHNNLGVLLVQQGQLQQATGHYRAALQANPSNAHAHANLGVILQQLNQFEAAIAHHQTAIQLDPNLAVAHTNLGHVLKELGRLDSAIAHYQTSRQLMPTNPDAYRDLGDALLEQGRVQEALALYNQAISLAPNHAELVSSRIRALLISGRLQEGFTEYDRWRLANAPQPRLFSQPVWDGCFLNGESILLYVEPGAGFGDSIQFIRYASLVTTLGGRVQVECPWPLVRLFQTFSGVETVTATGNPLPPFTVQASLLSLPRILGTTVDCIPNQILYLSVDKLAAETLPSLPDFLHSTTQGQLKVGIVWGGNVNHSHDRDRSCPFTAFQSFLDLPGIEFYSLQQGYHQTELSHPNVVDLSSYLQDFADTAAVIQQLDLVITVDTAVAHLAGALGKPVWILLAFAADWRWLMSRADSPWYPTARLFRQPQRRAWGDVCQQVAIALQELKERYSRQNSSR
jgi:tetratricopeptide (TPR) repeat protein